MNRILTNKVRCLLVQSQLTKTLWQEILLTVYYLINLSPSITLDFKTPYEMWYDKPTSYDSLKVFESPVYANISQGKLAPRAFKSHFILKELNGSNYGVQTSILLDA